MMRITVKRAIETLDHDVIAEAGSAYEGIEAYKQHKPDVVTLDITMPKVHNIESGIEAVQQIIAFDPNAKIIMLTSHGEQLKVMQAIKAGARAYLLKPLDREKLKDTIRKVLG